MGFISSSSFFKAGYGKPLREYISAYSSIETIVDFGDIQVFDGVTVYPVIVTLLNVKPNDNHNMRFWKISSEPQENFKTEFIRSSIEYPQSALSGGSWELETDDLRSLRDKITIGNSKLKDVFGSPHYGIKTGKNTAFIINDDQASEITSSDANSEEIIGPVLIGDDIGRWHTESRSDCLICTYRGVDIDRYPAVYRHLNKFRSELEPKPAKWVPDKPRDKWPGRKCGSYSWYELQDTVSYHRLFKSVKIVYPEFSQGAKFSMDKKGSYLNNKCFFINSDDFSLLAILNSKPIWFFLAGQAASQRGGEWRLELRTQYMDNVPLPPGYNGDHPELTALGRACQNAAEKRYNLQQALARRIPDLAPSGSTARLSTKLQKWWLFPDFSSFRSEVRRCLKADIPLIERSEWEDWLNRDKSEIARLDAEIKGNEYRIDVIVYSLFKLTSAEICLLEANA